MVKVRSRFIHSFLLRRQVGLWWFQKREVGGSALKNPGKVIAAERMLCPSWRCFGIVMK